MKQKIKVVEKDNKPKIWILKHENIICKTLNILINKKKKGKTTQRKRV